MDPIEKVKLARKHDRPIFSDYLKLFDGFIEMHGDRAFGDDRAIIGGVGYFDKTPLTIIGIDKGKDIKDKLAKNFGMPHPEGYRKALRLMIQAEKFNRPVVCFIDTSGAYPGLGAEERGQGEAIARNLAEMMALRTPILSIIIGEGGSGGALALAVANRIAMAENAIYSVISPEGCASILWKDPTRVAEACRNLKCTAEDLLALGVIETIIPETTCHSEGHGHPAPRNLSAPTDTTNVPTTTSPTQTLLTQTLLTQTLLTQTRKVITDFLHDFAQTPPDKIVEQRYQRFRKLGYT